MTFEVRALARLSIVGVLFAAGASQTCNPLFEEISPATVQESASDGVRSSV